MTHIFNLFLIFQNYHTVKITLSLIFIFDICNLLIRIWCLMFRQTDSNLKEKTNFTIQFQGPESFYSGYYNLYSCVECSQNAREKISIFMVTYNEKYHNNNKIIPLIQSKYKMSYCLKSYRYRHVNKFFDRNFCQQ